MTAHDALDLADLGIDRADVLTAIRHGVTEAMPTAAHILDALATWTPLPPGSHLRLGDDDTRGADVVALRSREKARREADEHGREERVLRERGEVMTERGDIVLLDKDYRLRIGP